MKLYFCVCPALLNFLYTGSLEGEHALDSPLLWVCELVQSHYILPKLFYPCSGQLLESVSTAILRLFPFVSKIHPAKDSEVSSDLHLNVVNICLDMMISSSLSCVQPVSMKPFCWSKPATVAVCFLLGPLFFLYAALIL